MTKSIKELDQHLLIESLEIYLYLTLLAGRPMFIERGENLSWAFEDVNRQLCFWQVPDASSTTKELLAINSRTADSIEIIIYGINVPTDALNEFSLIAENEKIVITRCDLKENDSYDFKIVQINKDNNAILIPRFAEKLPLIEKNLHYSYFNADVIIDFNDQPLAILMSYFLDKSMVVEITVINCHLNLSLLNFIFNKIKTISDSTSKFPVILLDSDLNGLEKELNASAGIKFYKPKIVNKKPTCPSTVNPNEVLKTISAYQNALNELHKLGLPIHRDLPKNWDSFAALSLIIDHFRLKKTNSKKDFFVLDAGGEFYSAILHQLAAYGFSNLYCMNLIIESEVNVGNIIFQPGDITNTAFNDEYFDAITCLSVIEHGINLDKYFNEMSRILKPGGMLVTSTDFWSEKIDTSNKMSYNAPVKIFYPDEIKIALKIAKKYNLHLVKNINLECEDKIINCDGFNYTFLYFSLTKSRFA